MKVILPWPPRELSPNARMHWRDKARYAKAAKSAAHWSAREQGGSVAALRAMRRPLSLCVTFHSPDKRRRDRDNLLASMKSAIDGVCQALGIDDAEFHQVTVGTGQVVAGGRVELEIRGAQ